MGLMSFMKEAGEKLFGRGEAKAAQEAAAAAPTPEKIAALSKAAGDAIVTYINAQGLSLIHILPSSFSTVMCQPMLLMGALQ